MKTPAWIESIAESSRARTLSFFVFALLTGVFTFLAWRAHAGLAASRETQAALARQNAEIGTAGSMDDFYNRSWLADERNFSQLAGYVDQLIGFTASRTLDPQFRQELSDYLVKNQAQILKESSRIETLSFSDGILRRDQASLLEMYDELDLVFHTMQDILTYWDVDTPLERGAKMRAIQEAFSTAGIEFQASTTSHRRILSYARQLEEQSQQASTTELDRVRANRALFTRSIAGLIASALIFAGWLVLLAWQRRREHVCTRN